MEKTLDEHLSNLIYEKFSREVTSGVSVLIFLFSSEKYSNFFKLKLRNYRKKTFYHINGTFSKEAKY